MLERTVSTASPFLMNKPFFVLQDANLFYKIKCFIFAKTSLIELMELSRSGKIRDYYDKFQEMGHFSRTCFSQKTAKMKTSVSLSLKVRR